MSSSDSPLPNSVPNLEDCLTLAIFCGHALEDSPHATQLRNSLIVLERQGHIRTWSQHAIVPGAHRASTTLEQLQIADLVLLLLSSDFFASDFCFTVQLQAAITNHLEGRQVVIPVLVRPCDWTTTPLGDLQALPQDASCRVVPVTQWPDVDSAWQSVVAGIRGLVAAKVRTHHDSELREKRLGAGALPAATTQIGRWSFVITGTVNNHDRRTIQAIVEHLRKISGDSTLTLLRVEEGSVKLVLLGTRTGYETLLRLLRDGGIREVATPIGAVEVTSLAWEGATQESSAIPTWGQFQSAIWSIAPQRLEPTSIPSVHRPLQEMLRLMDGSRVPRSGPVTWARADSVLTLEVERYYHLRADAREESVRLEHALLEGRLHETYTQLISSRTLGLWTIVRNAVPQASPEYVENLVRDTCVQLHFSLDRYAALHRARPIAGSLHFWAHGVALYAAAEAMVGDSAVGRLPVARSPALLVQDDVDEGSGPNSLLHLSALLSTLTEQERWSVLLRASGLASETANAILLLLGHTPELSQTASLVLGELLRLVEQGRRTGAE